MKKDALARLAQVTWTKPKHYVGFNPVGDFVVMTQHRDSDSVERCNFEVVQQTLRAIVVARAFEDPPEEPLYDAFPSREGALSPRSSGWVYSFSATHCMVGWVEYLMVREDAPESLRRAAGDMLLKLDDYPVLDEDALFTIEFEEACEFWKSMSVRDRVDMLEGTGISVFAARRDELPYDDSGYLMERLR